MILRLDKVMNDISYRIVYSYYKAILRTSTGMINLSIQNKAALIKADAGTVISHAAKIFLNLEGHD